MTSCTLMHAIGPSFSRKVRSKLRRGTHGEASGARNGEGGMGVESKHLPP